jgi:hypothetical protein
MRFRLRLLGLASLVLTPRLSRGQKSDAPSDQTQSSVPGTQKSTSAVGNPSLEQTMEAGESEEHKRKLISWNEYHSPYFTIRFGAGLLCEFDAYSQDEQSKEQFSLSPTEKILDFRFLLNGRLFAKWKWSVTWYAGIMRDVPTQSWFVCQTGVMIAVPELWDISLLAEPKRVFPAMCALKWRMAMAIGTDSGPTVTPNFFKRAFSCSSERAL